MRSLYAVVGVLSFAVSQCVFAVEQHDGAWWAITSPPQQLGYLLGLSDAEAEAQASCDLFWRVQIRLAPNKTCSDFVAKRQIVSESRTPKVGTFGQVMQGLSEFYMDYKNQMILVMHAMIIVEHKIRGTPDAEVQKVIEVWRKLDAR